MVILIFLFIITGIIIWHLLYNKKQENFYECSSTTSSMTQSGDRVYFTNTLLDGHYDKSALYNNTQYHQQNTNKKIVEYKNRLLDSKAKHDNTRRTFDKLSADIPGYYKRITDGQTLADNTIQGYKTQANNNINSTDSVLDAYIDKQHVVDVPGKIKNELQRETNNQLSRVRDTASNYNSAIDFNTYLTQETRDLELNGTKIINLSSLMSKIQEFLPYKSFKLLYSANAQTYSPNNFHDKCDNKTSSVKMATLTIYKTKSGAILLGYNSDGWQSYGKSTSSDYGTNWISLLKGANLGTNDPERNFNKCNVSKSLYNDYYSGPQFGSTELLIKDKKVMSSILIYKTSKSNNSTYGYDSKLDIQQDNNSLVTIESASEYTTLSFLPNGSEDLDSIEVFQVLDEMKRIYDWQHHNNKIVRVRGDTGNVQCYAKTIIDQQTRNCDETTAITDFNKLASNQIFAIDCSEAEYQNKNHWCSKTLTNFSKDPTSINYDVCPVGWSVSRDPNNPAQSLCYPLAGSGNSISLKVDTVQAKRSRTDARFPFKYDYTSAFMNDDLKTNIRKNISNVLGTSTAPIQVNLDRFNFNRNGVMINLFAINSRNTPPRGNKISTEMITTAINFNWGAGPIFRNRTKIFIEFITYVRIPQGAKRISFSLKADNSARLAVSKDGSTTNLEMVLNWGNTNTSASIDVKENTYLPIQVDYQYAKITDSASLTLYWSIDGKPMQIISRDNYFLSKEQCTALDAMGNVAIPISKDCSGFDCSIEGQLCMAGTVGAGTDDWICSNRRWVKQTK
jgi:hypothetical protein